MSNSISLDEVAQELRDVGGAVAESIKQHSIQPLHPDPSRRWWIVGGAALLVAAVVGALVWWRRSGEPEVDVDGLM